MDFSIHYLIHIRRTPAPLPAEKVPSHDLTFVHDGEFEYSIDGERFTVKSGEALFCRKGEERRRFESGEVYYTSINFDGSLPAELPHYIRHADSPELLFYLKRLLAIYEEDELAQERCSALLTLLLCELSRANPAARTHDCIEQVRELIRRDPAAKYTVAEFAKMVHLNASYLSTLWKRECGVPLSEYRRTCQLELAQSLLADPKLSIRDTADRASFCDVYYFSRIFRKRIGMTPSDYRRAMISAGKMSEKKLETIEPSKPRNTLRD